MKTTMQENRNRTIGSAGKKLFIVLFSLGLALGASAQRGGFHGGGGYAGGGHYYGGGYYGGWGYPRTYVGVGIGLGYPWWGWGYGWYGPWYGGYPAYYYGYGAMPNQLELQVRDIKSDYDARIKDVKQDKALSRKERRAKIDQLKVDRDNAIIDARHAYFYDSRRNFNNQYNNGQQPNNGNGNQNQQNQQNQTPKSGNNGSSSSDGPEYQEQGSNNSTGSK